MPAPGSAPPKRLRRPKTSAAAYRQTAARKRQTRSVKAVISRDINLVKVVSIRRVQTGVFNTQTAKVFEENLQRCRDVFCLSCSCKVTMSGLCQRLEQGTVGIAAESKRKNP